MAVADGSGGAVGDFGGAEGSIFKLAGSFPTAALRLLRTPHCLLFLRAARVGHRRHWRFTVPNKGKGRIKINEEKKVEKGQVWRVFVECKEYEFFNSIFFN